MALAPSFATSIAGGVDIKVRRLAVMDMGADRAFFSEPETQKHVLLGIRVKSNGHFTSVNLSIRTLSSSM